MTNTMFFQCFKLNTGISSISHQQAVAEHWDLPNTEIFWYKDVASAHRIHAVFCSAVSATFWRKKILFFDPFRPRKSLFSNHYITFS
jgi:hypothetical protein